MKLRNIALVAAVMCAFADAGLARDPLGEKASYLLDKNGARTSNMIQSGNALATVAEYLPEHENGPSYNVSLDYDFTVQFYGRQKGTTKWAFPQEFFEPSFMENLRQSGTFETSDYKIRHEGFADARNPDGGAYPHCDKILIYDVKVPEELARLIYSIAGYNPKAAGNPEIEDLKIRAHVFNSAPVLGAVKLDLSAKVRGMNVKAGFDYRRQ